jgi:CheY-like chemotaxis protein
MPARCVPSGLFLVAEEDKQVGRVISMFLKTLGYSAQEFRNGADAVAAFEAAPDAFACAIIDVGMKKCNGIETLGLLRKLNAKLPAILVSGSPLPTGRRAKLGLSRSSTRLATTLASAGATGRRRSHKKARVGSGARVSHQIAA